MEKVPQTHGNIGFSSILLAERLNKLQKKSPNSLFTVKMQKRCSTHYTGVCSILRVFMVGPMTFYTVINGILTWSRVKVK